MFHAIPVHILKVIHHLVLHVQADVIKIKKASLIVCYVLWVIIARAELLILLFAHPVMVHLQVQVIAINARLNVVHVLFLLQQTVHHVLPDIN